MNTSDQQQRANDYVARRQDHYERVQERARNGKLAKVCAQPQPELQHEQAAKAGSRTDEHWEVCLVPANPGGEQKHMNGNQGCTQEVHIEPLACVPEHRSTDELQVDEPNSQQAKALNPAGIRGQFFDRAFFPLSRGEKRETCSQGEERLRATGMDDRQSLLQEDDAQPAQHALGDHRAECDHSEPAQPGARFFAPQDKGQSDGEEAHGRPDQSMAVLVQDPAHHPRPGIQEHVVPKGGRPVGHGQAGARAGHQPANEQQGESSDRGQ